MNTHRSLACWMFSVAGFVVLILMVGGLTRLTDSGLSITEWALIRGILPPFTEAAWQGAFMKYQALPEYRLINHAMNLTDFKIIYWWEWGHRFLARLIGVIFIVPWIIFAWRRVIPHRLWLPLIMLLGLGAFQGFIGWFMVQSGLAVRVDVSPYRLVVHLGLGVLIFGFSFWLGLCLWRGGNLLRGYFVPSVRALILGLLIAQILLGGLVAGLDAGRIYTDWPRIDGAFIPSNLLTHTPFYLNFFENRLTVQFNHRILGYLLVVLIGYEAYRRRNTDVGGAQARIIMIGILVLAQASLGIITLILGAPLVLASLHQFGAIALLAVVLNDIHQTGYARVVQR